MTKYGRFSRELSSPINSRAFVCPKQGRWSSFRLVDESGCGKPYAGLLYTAIDSEGLNYVGMLDDQGSGKVEDHCAGPRVVKFVHEYAESDPLYTDLMKRDSYPLKISALQLRAEQTNYVNRDGARTERNAAQESADIFYQFDVGDLVEFCAHLPPVSERRFPVRAGPKNLCVSMVVWA
ncbi:hypothetical protein [Pseudomonas sp. SDI]|uniref:hypothetical protein n=1 Tax=Pseudomonas sp. SDI TaxID=2170734 RepID=UPI0010582753|nr:hypothetical protein [Pseudomonas sp. SDI]